VFHVVPHVLNRYVPEHGGVNEYHTSRPFEPTHGSSPGLENPVLPLVTPSEIAVAPAQVSLPTVGCEHDGIADQNEVPLIR
jgi:hypothetical protein